jgi:hypothetical protein
MSNFSTLSQVLTHARNKGALLEQIDNLYEAWKSHQKPDVQAADGDGRDPGNEGGINCVPDCTDRQICNKTTGECIDDVGL